MADIAAAAGASLDDLVACLVNVRPGGSGNVRDLFDARLSGASRVALTVVEMVGEYSGAFPFSLMCRALLPTATRSRPKRVVQGANGSVGVAAGGYLHLAIRADGADAAIRSLASLLTEKGAAAELLAAENGVAAPVLTRSGGGQGLGAFDIGSSPPLSRLVECSGFTLSAAEAERLSVLLSDAKLVGAVPPALSLTRAAAEERLSLECVALRLQPHTAPSASTPHWGTPSATAPLSNTLRDTETRRKTSSSLDTDALSSQAIRTAAAFVHSGSLKTAAGDVFGLRVASSTPASSTGDSVAKRSVRLRSDYAVVSQGIVYASPSASAAADPTDAFERLGKLLVEAGSSLDAVLSCRFYL